MLRTTTYQDALRAIGAIADRMTPGASTLRVVVEEDKDARSVQVVVNGERISLDSNDLSRHISDDRSQRGSHSATSSCSDLFRTVGKGIDALDGTSLYLVYSGDTLAARFTLGDAEDAPIDIAYDGEDLDCLRKAAVAQRHGDLAPRIVIVHDGRPEDVLVRTLLGGEFAVELLTIGAAASLKDSHPLPHVLIAYLGDTPSPQLVSFMTRLRIDLPRVPKLIVGRGLGPDWQELAIDVPAAEVRAAVRRLVDLSRRAHRYEPLSAG